MRSNYVSSNLKYLIGTKGITQSAFSKKIGWANATVNNYVNKKTEPSADKMMELAKFFNVSLDDLISVDMMKEGVSPKRSSKEGSDVKELSTLLRGLYKELETLSTAMEENGNRVPMLIGKIKKYKAMYPNAPVWDELVDELNKINYKL